MAPQPVLFEEHRVGQRKVVGVATLNAPDTLNALTQALLDQLIAQLQRWRADPRVLGLVLLGAGERAFCAGGDVVSLYRWMREAPGSPHAAAEHFLASEYRLHYLVHTFGKPVVAWGHGVAMGSGLGILVGASHRVVTETARLAMPEVGIGIFPDAGATWFLPRMPDGLGLYLGLTGTVCNAGDALLVGLGDYFIDSAAKEQVLEALFHLPWQDEVRRHHDQVTALLQEISASYQGQQPVSALRDHADTIRQVVQHDRVEAILAAMQTAAATDAWFRRGADALNAAAPTSIRMFFEQYRRGLSLSLQECFQLEAVLAIHCVRHTDFAEGIRARLIDKDMTPHWTPATLADVPPERLATWFTLPPDYAHNPLVDL